MGHTSPRPFATRVATAALLIASFFPVSVPAGAPNRAPQISGQPATEVQTGRWYSFRPVASDPDGHRLYFRIENRPRWLNFDGSTGRLWGYASSQTRGEYVDIRISVTDGWVGAALPPFRIIVGGTTPTNRAPTISGSPAPAARVGQVWAFTPTASDADGDPLSFAIGNRPSWASFNPATGALTGTPGTGAVGNHPNITIQVSDGRASTALQPFAISVSAATPTNQPPTISGSPALSARVGEAYAFTPVASDANGDTLRFTIANRPSWATFSTTTGALTGTPGTGTAGNYANIAIQVSDGGATASLPAFAIQVSAATPTNQAPTISGSPALSARVGQPYAFTPSASDANSDPLYFTIVNRPSWATFSTTTGALTGTPGIGAAGNYANITIQVSDGSASATLPAFTINVQPTVALGSATLSWIAPTTRTDGSPLTNLAGYRIRYGTSPGNYPNTISINSPALTSAVVSDLTPATWYFVVSAYDSMGLESANTAPVSKTIP